VLEEHVACGVSVKQPNKRWSAKRLADLPNVQTDLCTEQPRFDRKERRGAVLPPRSSPALCAGLMPTPSFVMIADVSGLTRNCAYYHRQLYLSNGS
jgi:hypothetical protein